MGYITQQPIYHKMTLFHPQLIKIGERTGRHVTLESKERISIHKELETISYQ